MSTSEKNRGGDRRPSSSPRDEARRIAANTAKLAGPLEAITPPPRMRGKCGPFVAVCYVESPISEIAYGSCAAEYATA
jgi:hypothetical protein